MQHTQTCVQDHYTVQITSNLMLAHTTRECAMSTRQLLILHPLVSASIIMHTATPHLIDYNVHVYDGDLLLILLQIFY